MSHCLLEGACADGRLGRGVSRSAATAAACLRERIHPSTSRVGANTVGFPFLLRTLSTGGLGCTVPGSETRLCLAMHDLCASAITATVAAAATRE